MPDKNNQKSLNIFSDEFISLIGEDIANQIIDKICQGLTEEIPPEPPTSLCLEILLFGIDVEVLKNLVKCVFTQFNPILIAQQVLNLIKIANGDNDEDKMDICKFALIKKIIKKINCLQSILEGDDLKENILQEILLHPIQLPIDQLSDIDYVIKHVIITQFHEFLIAQYDNFALKLCNKVTCIYSDIQFLSEQIKQVTINFPAGELGIIEIADAAASVAISFYSESRNFQIIFDAITEVSKLIQDLDRIYKEKLAQLEKLYSLSDTGCPTPIEAKQFLPTISEVSIAPPSTIIPIAGPQIPSLPIISP
ncbi:MAG: hypothetical protein KAX49_11070 [Halanaerobiales bacterium]|nr:hypothetical protein [Halanaerobiales bacterium]